MAHDAVAHDAAAPDAVAPDTRFNPFYSHHYGDFPFIAIIILIIKRKTSSKKAEAEKEI